MMITPSHFKPSFGKFFQKRYLCLPKEAPLHQRCDKCFKFVIPNSQICGIQEDKKPYKAPTLWQKFFGPTKQLDYADSDQAEAFYKGMTGLFVFCLAKDGRNGQLDIEIIDYRRDIE